MATAQNSSINKRRTLRIIVEAVADDRLLSETLRVSRSSLDTVNRYFVDGPAFAMVGPDTPRNGTRLAGLVKVKPDDAGDRVLVRHCW